jgi:hypothetical protein
MFSVLLVVSPLFAVQLIDTIYLKNGESLTGRIIEEIPGHQLTVEKRSGETVSIKIEEIKRIAKCRLAIDSRINYTDLVFLEDGVIFRGIIVERIPESSITIELENGKLVPIITDDIWKIVVEKQMAGAPRYLEPTSTHMTRLELQIKLSLAGLEARKAKGGIDTTSEVDSLQGEIDALQETIEELEKEREEAEEKLYEENEQISGIEEQFAELDRDLTALAVEIDNRIETCAAPELKATCEQKFAHIQRLTADLVRRAKEASLLKAQDPRLKQLEEHRDADELAMIIQSGRWNERSYRAQVATLVEGLPGTTLEEIFRSTKKTASLGYATKNLIPLLPFGSWRQGDYFGAAVGSGATLIGAALFMTTIDVAYVAGSESRRMVMTPLSWVGIGMMAGGYLFSLIEPFWFQSRSNARLRSTLHLE